MGEIRAGRPEGRLEEQWKQLASGAGVLAAAPNSELSGEILALQTELMVQASTCLVLKSWLL